MTIDERLDRLTGIVETLPSTVVLHDDQIESLIKVDELQQKKLDDFATKLEDLRTTVRDLAKSVAATERQWQAYVNTLPRQ
jgi:hypothetical protein